MSYVTALPAMLASAAGELQSIGSYPPDFRPTDAPWIPAGDRIPAGDGWGTSRPTSDR
jgi:hypothetical protein